MGANYERLSRVLQACAPFKRETGALDEARTLDAKAAALKPPATAPVPSGSLLYLPQTAAALTEDDARQIRALVRAGKNVWFLQTGGDTINPGNRWVARAYLEAATVRPGVRRGQVVTLSSALSSEGGYTDKKAWSQEAFDEQFGQVGAGQLEFRVLAQQLCRGFCVAQ